jgi:hypothetical protein
MSLTLQWLTCLNACAPQVSAFILKVKCTLVQALRLCTGRTVHRGSRGIALPYLDHGTRREWGVSVTPQSLFTPGKDPVTILREAGWAPGPVWMGVKSRPTGIRSPDCPTCSSFAIPTELQYDQYITQTNYVLSYGWQILNTRML